MKPKNYDRFFAADVPGTASGRRQVCARASAAASRDRAYRRPVDAKTLDRLVALAETIYNEEGQDLRGRHCSGHGGGAGFAPVPVSRRRARSRRSAKSDSLVDEYALASRLSYFLWSTMPDEELLRLAGE